MGFAKKQEQLGTAYGFNYKKGNPRSIIFDAKDGEFRKLSSRKTNPFHEMTVHILKAVELDNVMLFPSKEENATNKPYQWMNLLYVDLETANICSTLFKTYTHQCWSDLLDEIATISMEENENYDITDFIVKMKLEKEPFKGKDRNVIKFYIATDDDGDDCSIFDDKGKRRKNAKISFVDKEQYEKAEKFYIEQSDMLYDSRIIREYAEQNHVKEYTSMDASEQTRFIAACGSYLGYYSKDAAKKLLAPKAEITL